MLIKILSLLVLGAITLAAVLMPKTEATEAAPTTAPASLTSVPAIPAALPPDNPVELGNVHWQRDLEAGRAAAKASGKPLLILFQEVPGCGNCTRYGSVTLRHPLIVEAIETFFVPVCIYNNQGGADAAALQLFGEPSWNNPVVRIVHADNQDLVPRLANFGSSAQLVAGLRTAITKSGQLAPPYLDLLATELAAREQGTATATFAMGCFWSGEGALGVLPGVIETAPGFQDGREVVRVTYDPQQVQAAQLAALVQPEGISACSANDGFRQDREPKYYLAQTPWRFVPMTTLQACRANSLVGQGQSPAGVLSPRQVELGRQAEIKADKKWRTAIGATDLAGAWEAAWR